MYKVYDMRVSSGKGFVKGRGPAISPTFRNWGGGSAVVRRGLLLMLVFLVLSAVMVITACRQLRRSLWAGRGGFIDTAEENARTDNLVRRAQDTMLRIGKWMRRRRLAEKRPYLAQ